MVERPVTRAMLEHMFADIQAKSSWDLSKPMLWGYFFFARDRSRLETARRRLEADGFEFVAIVEPEVATDPLMLHVQKVEVHTVDSLLARNEGHYRLAEELSLESYDGMDVGPVEK